MFEEVTGRYNGPDLELQVLEFWREQQVFAQSLAQSAWSSWGANPLVIWSNTMTRPESQSHFIAVSSRKTYSMPLSDPL